MSIPGTFPDETEGAADTTDDPRKPFARYLSLAIACIAIILAGVAVSMYGAHQ